MHENNRARQLPSSTDSIGARFRRLRTLLGLTQAELAARLGLASAMGVSKYETGRTAPSLGSLRWIAEGVGVSLDWLVSGVVDDSLCEKFRSTQIAYGKLPEFCRLLGITTELARAIESHEISPGPGLVLKTCQLLGMNTFDFRDGELRLVSPLKSTGDSLLDLLVVKYRKILELLHHDPESEDGVLRLLLTRKDERERSGGR